MFQKLIENEALVNAMSAAKFVMPTDLQKDVIPQLITGGDFVVQATTGSGKTLCFVSATLNHLLANEQSKALILAPTRELAQQLAGDFARINGELAIASALVTSGEDFKKQAKALNDARIIIATVGRLEEHLENSQACLTGCDLLICDESDMLLSQGQGNSILAINEQLPETTQHWLFSATAKPLSHGFVKTLLGGKPANRIMVRELPENIDQTRLLADHHKHKQRLLSAMLSSQPENRVVIFVNTQKECQELGHYLRYQKYEVSFLHGGLDSKLRASALNFFVEQNSNILVATDVAARGLNMGEVDWVINFDPPEDKSEYVHRVGRCGREGNHGLAISFVTSQEWDLYAGFANSLGVDMPILKLDGYEGDYKGPKKLKKSGKAAKTKKRKPAAKKKK